jgi:uncharacterized protein
MPVARYPRLIATLGFGAVIVLICTPASAQFWEEPPHRSRQPAARPQQPSNPFGGLFEQMWQVPAPEVRRSARPPRRAQLGNFSKAPPPRPSNPAAKTRVLVIGDSMADWLGHGLEEAYSDDTAVAVVRSIRADTGLIPRKGRHARPDWLTAASALVAKERPDFVVVMLGLSDRTSFPEPMDERPLGRDSASSAAGNSGTERKPARAATSVSNREFRSDRWRELYAKRIDEMISAIKSSGVSVLWAGLPPIRGKRSRGDLAFLNDLYHARAEKAGITYVDFWNGFITEDGRFSIRGPDFDGQIRQLRSVDGVYFTKAGAVKLGHYIEREILRLITARAKAVAGVTPDAQHDQRAGEDASAPRPAAGPVISLTDVERSAQRLAGGDRAAPISPSPLARRVLSQGEALPIVRGRADDFSWPRKRDDALAVIPVPSTNVR